MQLVRHQMEGLHQLGAHMVAQVRRHVLHRRLGRARGVRYAAQRAHHRIEPLRRRPVVVDRRRHHPRLGDVRRRRRLGHAVFVHLRAVPPHGHVRLVVATLLLDHVLSRHVRVGAVVWRGLHLVVVVEPGERHLVHDVRIAVGSGGGGDAEEAALGQTHPLVAHLGLQARLVVPRLLEIEPDLQPPFGHDDPSARRVIQVAVVGEADAHLVLVVVGVVALR
mmetsp:Transcript_72124/g.191688  ORF Transcript_72124/g.191688 Transcript_72124/m.191688 type:complete len:221 (+) Transcript_72124:714-1376(+)